MHRTAAVVETVAGDLSLHAGAIDQFVSELENIRAETYGSINEVDGLHMRKVEWWGRSATLLGYATAWIVPNLFSAFCISLGQFTRWLLAHHILHRGYDRVPGLPKRYTSKVFARGWRRYVDWFDWIQPEAWDHEHNTLHHYHTGEDQDPDLVERYLTWLREARIPRFFKYLFIAIAALTWKYTYYAPNTASVLDPTNDKRLRGKHLAFITFLHVLDLRNPTVRSLWCRSYLPYGLFHFVLIPLCFLPLGSAAAWSVFWTKVMAECITNVHSFLVIGPNHTAGDLYRFSFHYADRREFYVTQILGSANYRTGNEVVDYLSIWLNYQIEHHLFPDLPMTKYREVQPRIQALCARYGVPYRQESIFIRFWKMVRVCVGKDSMRELAQFPALQRTTVL